VDGEANFFQRRRRRAAGSSMAAVCFGQASMEMFCCRIEQKKMSGGCAVSREEG
jgi:hypothetical protein